MTYTEYMNLAKRCLTAAEAEKLIELAYNDYSLSARQCCHIRDTAIKSALAN